MYSGVRTLKAISFTIFLPRLSCLICLFGCLPLSLSLSLVLSSLSLSLRMSLSVYLLFSLEREGDETRVRDRDREENRQTDRQSSKLHHTVTITQDTYQLLCHPVFLDTHYEVCLIYIYYLQKYFVEQCHFIINRLW